MAASSLSDTEHSARMGAERKRLLGHERPVGHTQSAGLVGQEPEENTNVPRAHRIIKTKQNTAFVHVVGSDRVIDHVHDGHADDEHHHHHDERERRHREHDEDILAKAREHHEQETGEAGGRHGNMLAQARKEFGSPNPNHVEDPEAQRLKEHEQVPGLK